MKNLIISVTLVLSTNLFSHEAVEALGERIFNDFRFSQYFYDLSQGNVNYELKEGASELDLLDIQDESVESPFIGGAMSCSSCHMVDQAFEIETAGMRGYNDFSRRTKVPLRNDGQTHTLRNTPTLVGIGSRFAQNRFSHYDGEFSDHSSTVLGNFTGRNMGWSKNENKDALKNIINIIKKDNGKSDLAQEFGGPYSKVFLGVDPSLTEDLRIPAEDRLDVYTATDDEIIQLIVKAVTTYMDGIDFETDEEGIYTGSTYDEFLKLNNIPRAPKVNQTLSQYTSELVRKFLDLERPNFIQGKYLDTHKKTFKFTEQEFRGLKLFFNISSSNNSRGMCVNCHMPPLFSDQQFHNVGVVQTEYDKIHGKNKFKKLHVPSLQERNDKGIYFLARPNKKNRDDADLGVWNFFGREGKDILTNHLMKQFCFDMNNCSKDEVLEVLLGRIKTPTLRNLNHSAPYFHNGSQSSLEEVVRHYKDASQMKRSNSLRNGAPQLNRVILEERDVQDLAAFLETLNSNYD